MSTTTGKTLNLVKPELTDDHKVTIGTDLPANFQKIDDAVTAHLADKAPHGQEALTYYVDVSKADNSGDGLTPATAFKNIQYAINILKKYLVGDVKIRVIAGDYTAEGAINVSGFFGPGVLTITGYNGVADIISNSDADSYEISRMIVSYCHNSMVQIQGLEAKVIDAGLTNNAGGFQAQYSDAVNFFYCRDVVANNVRSGYYFTVVKQGYVYSSIASNKESALRCNVQCGIINSASWTAGTGNTRGIGAIYGATVAKIDANQPQGTTAEYMSDGGAIR